jgi:hypothetical protein
MKRSLTTLAIAAIAAVSVHAAVVIDENGVGFVGKGDVQDAFGWNNAQLQANAAAVRFRFVETQQASWECEWWTGPAHNRTYHSVNREVVTAVGGNVAHDARKNKQGQITGFNLNGFEGAPVSSNDSQVGDCEGGKTLAAGSIQFGAGDGDAVLEVSIDGLAWLSVDLPIDEIDE